MPLRTFRLSASPDRADWPTFELAGFGLDGQPWSETFRCWPVAPAAVLEDLTTTIQVDPTSGRRRYSVPNCMAFMRAVLCDDDAEPGAEGQPDRACSRDRFEARMRNPRESVSLAELVQVTSWLSDVLTLRPTKPSSGSTPGGGTPVPAAPTPEAGATNGA